MSNLPVDHGWAWMCTFGAAVSMFFFVGMLRSLGILLVDVIIRFESSSAMASLLLGLMGAGVSLTAPLGNAFGARYDSYRSVVIWGTVLIFIATLATSFASTIQHVVFVYGIFGGIGMGVIAGPAIVTVGMYFDKRRSLANGLATAGGSVGQLVIPILIRFLLDEFSFQGGMMIFAALGLNVIPAALLLRPLSFYNRKKTASARKPLLAGKGGDIENRHTILAVDGLNGMNGHAKAELQRGDTTVNGGGPSGVNGGVNGVNGGVNGVNGGVKGVNGEVNGVNGNVKEKNGLVQIQNGTKGTDDHELNGHQHFAEDTNGDVKINGDSKKDGGYNLLSAKKDDRDRSPTPESDTASHPNSSNYFKHRQRKYSSVSQDSQAAYRQRKYSSVSQDSYKRKISVYSSQMSLGVLPPAGQLPETPKHAPWSQVIGKSFCCCCVKTGDNVVPLVTWRLFRSKVFCFYLFGVCMGNSGYLNALLFLPPYAEELKISRTTTAILMSAVGVADLMSRIFGGWFGDLGIITRHKQLALSLLITGISTLVCTFFPNFISLVVMLAILGLLGGFYLSLMAVVLVDLMGLENLSAGFGLTVMMQGITNIFLPTGLGFIRDQTGSYQVPFFICGTMMLLGGISFILQPILVKYEAKQKARKEAVNEEKEELDAIETNI